MKRNRILISSHVIIIDDLFDGKSFDEIRVTLDRLENDMIDHSKDYDYRFEVHHYYGDFSLNLSVYRDESDAEYKARMAERAKNMLAREKAKLAREKRKEKLRKELMAKESDERAEYERLKIKFGKEK